MELICGHGAPSYGRPLCPHIRAAAQPLGYFTRYTGVGLSVDRVCQACRDCVADGLAVVTDAVCEECFDVVDGDLVGWVGMPEVRDRPRDVDPTVRSTAVPVGLGAVVDLAAVDEAAAVWLALCEDGRIVRWESDSGTWTVLARSTVEVQEDAEPWAGRQQVRRLHVSPDGRFAAVVLDHGRHGEVFDLSTGTVTLTLDGGGYRPDTVRFSAAFAEHRGRTVLVHRTGWNRLDVSDPQTGQLLTVREFEAARTGSSRPPHDLDFFHGALTVSPDGRHVADDGWVWAPSGVVTAWSLSRWLDENPYESEDGPSLLCLTLCTHYWGRPVVWIDERRVAVGGLGEDDYEIAPGARIFDIDGPSHRTSGLAKALETTAFGGPDGRFFSDGGLLFSASPPGLEIWDPSEGVRLASVPDFRPTHHHRTARELVQLDGAELLRWSIDPSLLP
ncbi:hypothetical protein [Kitasatospora sp. McL0602]|uniref:hypothetical protein n=1 Tax=Kitasatospora sp. McL0602 TaxID=3439530 RepID=UPI003F890888